MALSTARCSKLCAVTLSYHNDNTLIKPFSGYKRIEVESSITRNHIRKIKTGYIENIQIVNNLLF